jgi:molecular chaperone GrpE
MHRVFTGVAALLLATSSYAYSMGPAVQRSTLPHSISRAAARCWPLRAVSAEPEEEPAPGSDADAAPPPPAAPTPATDGDDLLSSTAFLKQKLNVLQKELTQIEEETLSVRSQAEEARSEFAQQRTRLQTDFDNFKARHYNQTIDAEVDARIKLLKDFLAVLDNFDRARASIKPEGEAAEAVNAQYQDMNTKLMETLAALDVTQIETVGKEFDYNLHMAIQQIPSDEYDEGIVCAELQPGFLCKDKLLRPAYVMVSA